MAFIIKDRVKESTTSTGTGAITLGGAAATFDTFQSYMTNGDTTYYAIVHTTSGTDEWEVGLGTWNTGNTLTRTTVLAGSNGTSAQTFSAGAKDVFMTYPAAHAALAEDDVTFDNITVTGTVDGRDVATDGTKLDTVEQNADATDAVNVAAAGALMRSGGTMTGALILNANPSAALGAATKEYVDTIASAGIHYHSPVRAEHPSNLNATYNNGSSGVGATLTNAGTNAALVLDSVSMVLNDRVLVANQTTQTQNGVYTVTTVGDGSTAWVLTRSTDTDTAAPSDPDAFGKGDAFFIKEGATNAGHLDVLSTAGTIVFGTTNIVFSEVAETTVYSGGTGITLTGTTFAIGQDVGTTSNVTFNQVTAAIIGNVTGNVTGDLTGNADTATALATARTVQLSGDVTGSATFDGSANINITAAVQDDSHAHVISNVDGLQTALDARVPTSRTLTAGNGLTGGGDLTANRTFTVGGGTGITVNANDIAIDSNYTGFDSRYVNVTGDTMTGDLSFGDNDKAIFGAGDLQIYHNSANNKSYIEESGTGNLVIRGSDIDILSGNGEAAINVAQDGAVTLYNDNNAKLATTATGIDVTGTVTADDILLNTGGKFRSSIDTSSVALSGGTNSNVGANIVAYGSTHSSAANDLIIRRSGTKFALFDGATGDINFYEDTGTTPKFFWSAADESLGINTSSPATKLHIAGSSSVRNTIVSNVTLDGGVSVVNPYDGFGFGIDFIGRDYGNAVRNYAGIYTEMESQSSSAGGGDAGFTTGLSFYTNAGGASDTDPVERMRISSAGSVGIGITPESWVTGYGGRVLQIGDAAVFGGSTNDSMSYMLANAYYDSVNSRWEYINTDFATRYEQLDGEHIFYTAASGTANAAITWSQAMKITSSGNINISSDDKQIYWGAGTTAIDASSANNRIRFYTANSEAMRISAAGSVGIGTASIDNMVNIQESALAGRGASNGNTSLTLEHATDTGIQFFSATQTQLRFGDAASTGAGSIIYEHGTDKLRLSTSGLITFEGNGAEIMSIDASGNLTTNGTTFKSNSNVPRNFKLQPSATSTDVGLSHFAGNGSHGYQLYSDGTNYGFLDANWGSWDLKKVKNGALYVDEGSGQNRVFTDAYHPNADKWTTARTLTLSGDVTGSVSWDGTANASISASLTASPSVTNLNVATSIIHTDDTDTAINFDNNQISMTVGGSTELYVNTDGVRLGDSGNGYFQPVTGSYGSIQIDGGAHGGWEGYSIGARAVFMHDNSSTTGLYNDVNNEWLIKCVHNGSTFLYNNGSEKFQTTTSGAQVNGGLTVTGTVDGRDIATDGTKLDGIATNANNYSLPATPSVTGLNVAEYITHTGDTDTYMQFNTNEIVFRTGGVDSLTINPSDITSLEPIAAPYFEATSDINLKTNIKKIVSPLEMLSNLNGYTFNWKKDGKASTGVMAQEVEKVLPSAVSENNDGDKRVNYNELVGVLIEAVKEQQIQIDALKNKLGE